MPDNDHQRIDDKDVSLFFYQITKTAASRREAIAMTAREFGLSTNDVYARLERAKSSRHLDRSDDDLLP
jgi:hypothetical protein